MFACKLEAHEDWFFLSFYGWHVYMNQRYGLTMSVRTDSQSAGSNFASPRNTDKPVIAKQKSTEALQLGRGFLQHCWGQMYAWNCLSLHKMGVWNHQNHQNMIEFTTSEGDWRVTCWFGIELPSALELYSDLFMSSSKDQKSVRSHKKDWGRQTNFRINW